MKKGIIGSAIILILFVMIFILAFYLIKNSNLTGSAIQQIPDEHNIGPSIEEQTCMQDCVSVGCQPEDKECMVANSEKCGQECGVDTSGPPTPTDKGEACMQECVVKGCEEFDFQCQRENKENCEGECDMKGDAPDESEMNEEQLCITHCVAAEDSSVICGNSKEGETGNALCQRCAQECVHLYAGPCLNDEQIGEKEKECETCEHCYGEPVMEASGEGWDCIVDVECKDASSEWGDEPGKGPGIGQEGYVAPNPVAKAVDGIIKFFKGIFSENGEEGHKSEEASSE